MTSQNLSLQHPIVENSNITFISTDYTSGTTLEVKNTAGFNANDYILIGKYGMDQSEIGQITSVTDKDTLVVSALKYPHPFDTTVTFIPYNKWRIYRSTTGIGGTYSLLTELDLFVDDDENYYTDNQSLSSYSYKYCYYNTTTGLSSDFTDEIPYGGFPDWSLKSIQDNVLNLFGDNRERFLDRDMITYWCNELYRRLQYIIVGSESPYFITSQIFNSTGSQEYDLTSYAMINIFMVELSMDGGITWNQSVTPKDFRLKDNPGSITTYEYRLSGQEATFYPAIPVGYMIKIWYTTNPTSLVNPADVLMDPFKILTDLFVDHCLMRAHEKDRKMTELAAYYRNKVDRELNDPDGLIKKLKRRIKQGNMVMATTWGDDYDQI